MTNSRLPSGYVNTNHKVIILRPAKYGELPESVTNAITSFIQRGYSVMFTEEMMRAVFREKEEDIRAECDWRYRKMVTAADHNGFQLLW